MSIIPRAGAPAPVFGRDDLTCPLTWRQVGRLVRLARATPWMGQATIPADQSVSTTAILDPGRPTSLTYTLDTGHHNCGWWANSQYDTCWHLSITHPNGRRRGMFMPPALGGGFRLVNDTDAPSDDEIRAWARVFFGDRYTISWIEQPSGTVDRHRLPNVGHARLFLDKATGYPIMPAGEVYHLRPFTDGTSPPKILDGRLGADVR